MLLALSKFLPRVLHKKSDRPCSAGSGNTKPTTCRVVLLDDSELSLDMKLSAKGCVLLDRVFLHLNLVEKEYFGLRFLDMSHQPLWLDLTKSIHSQIPAGDLPCTFYFGVKFYAIDPCKLVKEITRYQFFLQVKQDILQCRLPVSVDMAAQLSAYAVQSELGDFNEAVHCRGYVSEFSFVPNQTLDFENRVSEIHKTLSGQVPAQAEYHYLDTVKWLDMYGVDLHPVTGDGNIDYFLGLTPSGIVIYKNRVKISNYFWPRVLKITYKNKFFVIKARDKDNQENTLTFESSSKQACKLLYRCCIDYHTFYRLTSAGHSFQHSKAKLLSFTSSMSYSGKHCKSSSSSASQQTEQIVERLPSARKFQKRTSGTESCPEDTSRTPLAVSTVAMSQPVNKYANKCQRRSGYGSGPESSRYSCAASWEDNRNRHGLYSNRESSTSAHGECFLRRIVSGSESDSTICPRRHNRSLGRPSDTETEIESYRRRRIFSGPESESDAGSRGSHRRHHHHRRQYQSHSTESVSNSESQQRCSRIRIHNDSAFVSSAAYNTCDNSRWHKRGSKSPGLRPPQELAQHFRKIEDPSELGVSSETFQDLPYFRVEVLNQRFSPRTRHRIRQYRRQRNCGDLQEHEQSKLPDGEAPPPYLGPPTHYPCSFPSNTFQIFLPQRLDCELLCSPVAVQMREAYTAPIVKTKGFMCPTEDPLVAKDQIAMRHDVEQQPSDDYKQLRLSCRALNLHTREDSGLDLDSLAGSSSSQAAESLQKPSPLSSECVSVQSEHSQRNESPANQRRHCSSVAETLDPNRRTSPCDEQAQDTFVYL